MFSLTFDEIKDARNSGWDVTPYKDTYIVHHIIDGSENARTAERNEDFQAWIKDQRSVPDEDYKQFPDVISFDYYLRDGSFYERMADELEEQGYDDLNGSFDALIKKMDRPFYEVKLSCEVNTATGEVTINSVSR